MNVQVSPRMLMLEVVQDFEREVEVEIGSGGVVGYVLGYER